MARSLFRGRSGPLVAGLSLLATAVAPACTEDVVDGFGEFGRPIRLVQDESALPRLLMQAKLDSCNTEAGICPAACLEGEPASCPDDACMPVLIASGSPFTVLPDEGYALREECVAVRQGHVGGESGDNFAETVTRFRFDPVPTLRAPADKAGPWEWHAGTAPALEGEMSRRVDLGAVVGGNMLKHFAVRLTDDEGQTTVTFYGQFPGTEKGLADLGFSFLRLQYPGQLTGSQVDDRCAFGEGVACDLDQLQLQSFQGDQSFERTRMVLDACMAPPPCAPLWEVEDSTGRRSCELRPGRVATLADAARRCTDADAEEVGGRGASLIVSTGVDGLILFEDSARRMFGDLAALPSCEGDEGLTANSLACRVPELAELHVVGYGRAEGLARIRVRSLALVAGYDQPSSPNPCTRYRRRLDAAELQCRGLDDFDRPHAPDVSTELRTDDNVLALGETRWGVGQSDPNPANWILTTVLPADDTITMNVRRESGTETVEPDGMLGTALLRGTDVVLDYTEQDESLGVRVACTTRTSKCQALPACSPQSERLGENGPGRKSCCWGMPANLVEDALTRPGNEAEACCETLTAAALERVQKFGACPGVTAPGGIGGITP